MDFARVARTLQGFFEERNLPFALVGGLGLHAYGLHRVTFDLDLVTDAAARSPLIDFLESLGYRTLHSSRGYSNHAHPEAEWGRVDLVYVRGETSRELFGSVRTLEIAPGLALPVAHPEHLAAMKIHAMKSDPDRARQEMVDLRHLLSLPEVDREAIREQFEKRSMLDKYRELVDDEE